MASVLIAQETRTIIHNTVKEAADPLGKEGYIFSDRLQKSTATPISVVSEPFSIDSFCRTPTASRSSVSFHTVTVDPVLQLCRRKWLNDMSKTMSNTSISKVSKIVESAIQLARIPIPPLLSSSHCLHRWNEISFRKVFRVHHKLIDGPVER